MTTATATRLTRSASSVRLLPAIGVVVWRHLVQIRHNPEQLVELAIQPVLFVLLFGIVLAGQMGGAEGDYLSFVVPGLMIQATVLVTARTAIGLHADVTSGLMQRLQTLPLSRLAPLAGRIVADFLMLLWSLTILVATAVIIGYRASVTVPAALAVLGVIFGFGFSLSWVAILAGLTTRSAESVQAIAFGTMLPLTILSGAFVDTATVPAWLRPVMTWNPVSIATDTVRALIAGADIAPPLLRLTTTCVVLLAVFMPLAARAYARER